MADKKNSRIAVRFSVPFSKELSLIHSLDFIFEYVHESDIDPES